MTPCWGCVDVGAMLDPSWAMLGLRPTWSSVGTTSAHVRSKLRLGWPILGLCWPICGLCWGQVCPFWGCVGAMLAHLGSMLGPGSPILGLCWGYVGPPAVILGYVVFMSSPSFPNFA